MAAPSEVSITGHAIRYLEAAGGGGSDPGVSGKLETSGETARGCYLFCSCLTFLSLCLRLSEEVTHTLVWHHCQLKAQFFHQQFKIFTIILDFEFLSALVDRSNIYDEQDLCSNNGAQNQIVNVSVTNKNRPSHQPTCSFYWEP